MGPSMKTESPPSCRMASSKVSLVRSEGFSNSMRDGLAVERVRIVARRLLHLGGQIEQVEQFVVGEVEIAQQILAGGFQDRIRSKQRVHGGHLDCMIIHPYE